MPLRRSETWFQNQESAMGEWRDISSAPRDGTMILAFYGRQNVYELNFWHKVLKYWVSNGSANPAFEYNATHWMPLPDPPKGGEGDGIESLVTIFIGREKVGTRVGILMADVGGFGLTVPSMRTARSTAFGDSLYQSTRKARDG